MTTKQYEQLAKEITGIEGKYIGQGVVKLSDGSTISFGETIALQTFGNASVLYVKDGDTWTVSTQYPADSINLEEVYTFAEAAKLYGLEDSTLRKAVTYGRFKDGEIRKSGRTWLVTKAAMERLYKKEGN